MLHARLLANQNMDQQFITLLTTQTIPVALKERILRFQLSEEIFRKLIDSIELVGN